MKGFDSLCRFFLRFRYPVSLPEDIALALGINLTSFLTFKEFINHLTCSSCKPTRLCKFMPRQKAEEAFETALRKEYFKHNTLFSYYFNEGWMEFILQFDKDSRLRRIYIQHKFINHDRGIELCLLPHMDAFERKAS